MPDYSQPWSLYFLLGPIRGGADWQHEATTEIFALEQRTTVACPCRWDSTHALAKHFIRSNLKKFDRQLEWEQYYLRLAGIPDDDEPQRPKCIIAYLPFESEEFPHPGPEPYAMDTRGELGEWRMRMKYENAKLVIGADPKFHGLSQIQRNFSAVLGYDFPIYPTIRETVRAAYDLAHA